MIKAKGKMKDGRAILILGLSHMNIAKLGAGQPLFFDMDAMKMSPDERLGAIAIFVGTDEAAMTRTLSSFFGPDTDVIAIPRGSNEPV